MASKGEPLLKGLVGGDDDGGDGDAEAGDGGDAAVNVFDMLTPEECEQLEAAAQESLDAGEFEVPEPGSEEAQETPDDEAAESEETQIDEAAEGTEAHGAQFDLGELATAAGSLREECANFVQQADAAVEQAKQTEDGDPKKASKAADKLEKLAKEVEKAADECEKAVDGEDYGKAAKAYQKAQEAHQEAAELLDEVKSHVGGAAPAAKPAATPAGGKGGGAAAPPPPAKAGSKGGAMGTWAKRAAAAG